MRKHLVATSARGFTLVEVLISVAVVGILVALATPDLQSAKGKAYDTTARNDLRSAMAAQEAYFNEHQTYAPSVSQLDLGVSDGVVLGGGGSATGYLMTARHSRSTKTFSAAVDASITGGGGAGDPTPPGSASGGPKGDLRGAS